MVLAIDIPLTLSQPHGVSWISRLPQQNQTNIDFNDYFYRSRLRALQAVDEIINSLINRLSAAGELENTFIFYSTDNGYHIGSHRLQPGKQCAFEDDINIPLIVRGPDMPKNRTTDLVTTHTDLAPTFLSVAGGKMRDDFDGSPISLTAAQINLEHVMDMRTEHINVESWGIIMSEGKYGSILYPNHTYKALRVIGKDYSLLYTVWCSGEHELYDLVSDPYEMNNLYGELSATFTYIPDSGTPSCTVPIAELLPRLDALLMVLKTCTGRTCVRPWDALHPDRTVVSLCEALDPKYDDFYSEQKSVEFTKCEKGYILESEKPERAVKSYVRLDELGEVGVMVDEVHVPRGRRGKEEYSSGEKTEL